MLLTDWLTRVLFPHQVPELSQKSLVAYGLLFGFGWMFNYVPALALTSILASRLAGRTLGEALSWAGKRAPFVIGYTLPAMLAVLAGMLCLVLPGIYLALRLFPVFQVALFEPDQQPLTRSWELTRDRALEVFLASVGLGCVLLPLGISPIFVSALTANSPVAGWVAQTVNLIFGAVVQSVFWLQLYGWFREEMNPSGLGFAEVQLP